VVNSTPSGVDPVRPDTQLVAVRAWDGASGCYFVIDHKQVEN
jgi:hypothetical protein